MTTEGTTGRPPATRSTASPPGPQRVGRLTGAFGSATGLCRGLNLWPPFLLTGIRVDEVSDDFRRVRVRLRRSRLAGNHVGTQFEGSTFAMGRSVPDDHDAAQHRARLRGPGQGGHDRARRAVAHGGHGAFDLDPAVVAEVRAAADAGEKVLRWFEVDVVGTDGTVVARVRRQLHVRRAPSA